MAEAAEQPYIVKTTSHRAEVHTLVHQQRRKRQISAFIPLLDEEVLIQVLLNGSASA